MLTALCALQLVEKEADHRTDRMNEPHEKGRSAGRSSARTGSPRVASTGAPPHRGAGTTITTANTSTVPRGPHRHHDVEVVSLRRGCIAQEPYAVAGFGALLRREPGRTPSRTAGSKEPTAGARPAPRHVSGITRRTNAADAGGPTRYPVDLSKGYHTASRARAFLTLPIPSPAPGHGAVGLRQEATDSSTAPA